MFYLRSPRPISSLTEYRSESPNCLRLPSCCLSIQESLSSWQSLWDISRLQFGLRRGHTVIALHLHPILVEERLLHVRSGRRQSHCKKEVNRPTLLFSCLLLLSCDAHFTLTLYTVADIHTSTHTRKHCNTKENITVHDTRGTWREAGGRILAWEGNVI